MNWTRYGLSNFQDVISNPSHHLMVGHQRKVEHTGCISIEVKDSGAGLTKENEARLFSEGVQFDANKLQAGGGSGLGLWISKALVQHHGGTMIGSSDGLGCGCLFRVELPTVRVIQSDNKNNHKGDHKYGNTIMHSDSINSSMTISSNTNGGNHGEKHLALSSEFSSKMTADSSLQKPPMSSAHMKSPVRKKIERVLVVDDAPLNRKMVSRMLRTKGIKCDEAEHGEDCLQIVQSLHRKISTLSLKSMASTQSARSIDNNKSSEDQQQAAHELLLKEFEEFDNRDCSFSETDNASFNSYVQSNKTDNVVDGVLIRENDNTSNLECMYDLILLDYEMPILNGPLTAVRLKEMGFGHLPVVGITGNVLAEDTKYFMDCGALAVIHKPLTADKLSKTLDDISQFLSL